MTLGANLRRDQFAAFMVAERDAVLRDATPVEVVCWPELDDRQRPAVEFIGRDRLGLVSVEHTAIESYPAQIAARKALQAMFPLGGPEIAELVHAPQFRIMVRVDELLAVPRHDRSLVGPAVAKWVREVILEVPWPHVPGQPPFVRTRIHRPSLEVCLERWIADIGFVGPRAHVVPVGAWRPADLEQKRRNRLERALRDKVPKLLAAANQARTILVLEDRDMCMSAPALVSRALATIERVELPDVIYLLNVTSGDPLLTPIYASGRWWHEHKHGLLTFPPARAASFMGLAL